MQYRGDFSTLDTNPESDASQCFGSDWTLANEPMHVHMSMNAPAELDLRHTGVDYLKVTARGADDISGGPASISIPSSQVNKAAAR